MEIRAIYRQVCLLKLLWQQVHCVVPPYLYKFLQLNLIYLHISCGMNCSHLFSAHWAHLSRMRENIKHLWYLDFMTQMTNNPKLIPQTRIMCRPQLSQITCVCAKALPKFVSLPKLISQTENSFCNNWDFLSQQEFSKKIWAKYKSQFTTVAEGIFTHSLWCFASTLFKKKKQCFFWWKH
jgi:hypothetical protein